MEAHVTNGPQRYESEDGSIVVGRSMTLRGSRYRKYHYVSSSGSRRRRYPCFPSTHLCISHNHEHSESAKDFQLRRMPPTKAQM